MLNQAERQIIKKEFKTQTEFLSTMKTISSIKDEKDRQKFIRLTIDIMEEAISDKIDSKKAKEWERIAKLNEISISLQSHIIDFGGYSIYALRGLKTITGYKSREGSSLGLVDNFDDLNKFSKRLSLIRSRLKGRVLDFGCSVGWVSFLLRNKFGSDSYGIDIDEKAIDLGRLFESGKLYKSIPVKGRYLFPFNDKMFDIIVSKATLFEAPSNGLASYALEDNDSSFHHTMNEISRVLKKDGILLVETNLDLGIIFRLMDSFSFIYLDSFKLSPFEKEWKVFQKYE